MPKNVGLYNNDLSVPRKKDIDDLANVVDGKYSATNPPPYPVTSVNGQTGAVMVESGGVNIVTQPNQPSGQSPGDFWYKTEINALMLSSPGEITIRAFDGQWDGTMEYSTDGKEWIVLPTMSSLINSVDGVLYMRGTGNTIVSNASSYGFEISGDNISCTGNIENLLDYKTVAAGGHPSMGNYCFANMFANTHIVTPPELPATELSTGCYARMFQSCAYLTTAPELPATELATGCYQGMFKNCTSLVTAPPELPAIILTEQCYNEMFSGCTSLITAPSIQALIILGQSCYQMFFSCTALTTLPRLMATRLTNYCYQGMFKGCTKIKLSATKTGEYTQEYRIPTSGTGSGGYSPTMDMFVGTGGTFAGTPSINTTYYLSSSNTIV